MKNRIKLTSTLILSVALTFTAVSCASQDKSLPSANSRETEAVTVAQGKLTGIYSEDEKVEIFAGIPYAKAPVGDLRWKEPEEVLPWNGIYKADHFKAIAWQKRNSGLAKWIYRNLIYHDRDGDREEYAPLSEDCLYLNIWRPAGITDTEKLPVLFYIHGGSLMSGSGIHEAIDGQSAAKKGVIFVTINYRLGVFGYLALDELENESPNHTTGNYGLLDQIAALTWVHENISAFGGDPENITIAGESAGATSVSALCVSPLAKGLFRRAIAESSGAVTKRPPHTYREMQFAKETGENIKKEFKAETLSDLRKIPAEKLIKTKYSNNGITVDGYAIKERPWDTYQKGENNEEAILGGFNAREGFFFNFFGGSADKKTYESKVRAFFGDFSDEVLSLYPAKNNKEAKENWDQICGAVWFANSHHVWSELIKSQGKDAWEYYFTKENGGIGTNHSGEIIYAYGNVPKTKYYSESDHRLEKTMLGYWTNFAKTGNPNGEGLPLWPRYNDTPDKLMELGENTGLVDDPHLGLYKVLDKMYN